MKDFINRQLEISDKLFKVMFDDHQERIRDIAMWAELDASLMRKLDERDAEITRLQEEIAKLKADK